MAPKAPSFDDDSVVLSDVRKAGANGDVAQQSSMPHGKPQSTDKSKILMASTSQSKQRSSSRDENGQRQRSSSLLPWLGAAVWPLMLFVPLMLAYSPYSYDVLFPEEWYLFDGKSTEERPKPLGLCLGIIAVGIGQIFVLCYFYLHSHGCLLATPNASIVEGKTPSPIQRKGAPKYDFMEGVQVHLSQPEGFVLLATYLSVTWMCHWMPAEYYSFEGGIQWGRLALCLISQDGIQYLMHLCEHNVSAKFYQLSHKPHHKFTNPRLFDAFNGSVLDTILMILIPLYSTALLVHCNVWTCKCLARKIASETQEIDFNILCSLSCLVLICLSTTFSYTVQTWPLVPCTPTGSHSFTRNFHCRGTKPSDD
jgi:hypothetical protein